MRERRVELEAERRFVHSYALIGADDGQVREGLAEEQGAGEMGSRRAPGRHRGASIVSRSAPEPSRADAARVDGVLQPGGTRLALRFG